MQGLMGDESNYSLISGSFFTICFLYYCLKVIVMSDIVDGNSIPVGRTYSNSGNSLTLTIPKEFAKGLDIENSKVSMSFLDDIIGNRYLVVTKYYKEIVTE
jgi:hypothetical protein